ncbi:MAG: mechanosensitive ion channel domain-containing protein [Thermodesulfobacteriota bacterium]
MLPASRLNLLFIAGLLFSTLLLLLFGPAAPGLAESGEAAEKSAAASLDKGQKKLLQKKAPSLEELMGGDVQLAKERIDLEEKLATMVDPLAMKERIPELEGKIEELAGEIDQAGQRPQQYDEQLAVLEMTLQGLEKIVTEEGGPYTQAQEELILAHVHWAKQQQKLTRAMEQIQENDALQLVAQDVKTRLEQVNSALELLGQHLEAQKTAVTRLEAMQVHLYGLEAQLREISHKHQRAIMTRTAPPFFAAEYWTSLRGISREAGANLGQATYAKLSAIKQELDHLIVLTILSLTAWGWIRRCAGSPGLSPRCAAFTRRPLATALFPVLTIYTLTLGSSGETPYDLTQLIHLAVVITLLPLSLLLIPSPGLRKFFSRSVLFLALTMLLQLIALPQPLMRFYIFAATCGGLILCGRQAWQTHRKQKNRLWLLLALELGALFMLVIMGSTFLGLDKLSQYLFTAFLRSLVNALTGWMLYQVTISLTELILSRTPLPLLRRHSQAISRELAPLFATAYLAIFGLRLLQILLRHPFSLANMGELLTSTIPIFSFKMLNLGVLLTTAAIIYATILFSRWLRALLSQELLPRYNIQRGAQLSVTRIVHYAVVLLGFIVLLKALGLELTQLTILGGALGVGLGFGMQAIFNNFVSGLILLFERPIKVGDIIQVGEEMGEIKDLGLRATVVKTYDNAEIVIPNADLITGQVTNWTLAERLIRIRVPVGVAYGSNIGQVMEILLACAEEHPLVLSTPKPRALFLAFGASSLDFELLAWIPDVAERLVVLSELNQEINDEFTAANIEIPFPQQDLHLRSVDPAAGQAIGPGKN